MKMWTEMFWLKNAGLCDLVTIWATVSVSETAVFRYVKKCMCSYGRIVKLPLVPTSGEFDIAWLYTSISQYIIIVL